MSPLYTDLQKMWHSPTYLVFRFTLNEKEYLGRPIDLLCKKEANEPAKHIGYRFQIYRNMVDYRNGIEQDRIEIKEDNVVKNISPIDTKSTKEPSSLYYLSGKCNELNEIKLESDIGIIKHNIPFLLDNILEATWNFLEEHPQGFINNLSHFIDLYKTDIRILGMNATDIERKELIKKIKDGILSEVSLIIRNGEGTEAIRKPL